MVKCLAREYGKYRDETLYVSAEDWQAPFSFSRI